ncbi:formate dehydrogenase subunit gamma [Pseudooceanicola sp.]|uniref:formate dehydrogenase subunit gamma n=1 Tax=Pseudooceanicola sp. TaxID=1914328 RepID=UPI0035C70638
MTDSIAPQPEEIRAVIATERHREGPLLPILHALQAAYGYIPETALPIIAETLGLTRAEVHGVISFYHDFRSAPAARHTVKICRAEACQSVGANALTEAVLDRFGLDAHGTTPDGQVTIEPVYCLGLCACGPAAMIDGKVLGRADTARITAALEVPA